MTINPARWKISLPIHPIPDVMDNSMKSEFIRCFRLGLYRYILRRGFEGHNYAIQYGLAYHKYREVVENLCRERNESINNEIQNLAVTEASKGWSDPPIGHKHAHLDMGRLATTFYMAFKRIELEQRSKSVVVTRSEDSFDLELPFKVCRECGWAYLDHPEEKKGPGVWFICPHCRGNGFSKAEIQQDEESLVQSRHGGRVDQFVEFNGNMYIRDWKTTGYMPMHYDKKFDPNSQIQGYVWAGSQLAGRTFHGALIETVYNTKSKGPEFTQHYVNFSQGQMQQWIASQMMYEQFIRTSYARIEELGYLAFPQNTMACTSMGLCGFREACLMGSAKEIESWLLSSTKESFWDFMNPEGDE